MEELFYKDESLPFVECRYTKNSIKHYKPHFHNTLSIGAIDEEDVLYKVGDKEALLKPGSLAIINPQAIHSCNPIGDKKRSYYMLYLETKWCLDIQKYMFKTDSFINSSTIILKDKNIYDMYIKTVNTLMKKVSIFKKEQMLIELMQKIFEKTISQESVSQLDISFDIAKAKEILQDSFRENISLQEVAKMLDINPYLFIRSFKKYTNTTPHQYRINLRIELSKKLLQKGKKINDVALECGFFDQSHFQKQFKAIVLTTPQEYQKNF